MNNNLKIIGENIRVYRLLANLTQQELADKLGVNHQSISRWERGEHQIKIDHLASLAAILNVPVCDLIEGIKPIIG